MVSLLDPGSLSTPSSERIRHTVSASMVFMGIYATAAKMVLGKQGETS